MMAFSGRPLRSPARLQGEQGLEETFKECIFPIRPFF